MNEIETNQDSVAQPIQVKQPNKPVISGKNNNVYKYLFFVAVVLVLGTIVGFYYVLNNKNNQLSNKQSVETTPTTSVSNSTTTIDKKIISVDQKTDSTLVEISNDNYLYTNNKFGFSLVIPKTLSDRGCIKTEVSEELISDTNIPLVVFEHNRNITFTGEYYNEFETCQKITTTSKFPYDERNLPWFSFSVENINDEKQLKESIKSSFGSSCKVGEITKWSDNNDLAYVEIIGDEKGCDDTLCFTCGSQPLIGYSQNHKLIFYFGRSQECLLWTNKTNCAEDEIIDSLKFL